MIKIDPIIYLYAVFDNQATFDGWITLVNTYLGYPKSEAKTDTYTTAIPNEHNEKVIALFWSQDLTPELLEGIRQITREEAINEGLFPPPPED